ncbi:MAG: DUF255 domain-containing protein [Gammaproteobacteria bacterium]|nr:DUF255 domain-containing protein [Gammaproteobacteria bacterium]
MILFSAPSYSSVLEDNTEIGTPLSEPSSIEKKRIVSELEQKLQTAYKNKGSEYKPRTEHFNVDGSPKYTNRLILEESPYLIQHAHNPVNWYAWGKEAFEKARQENKPVFLSIGYSTCHWCHVMERESFDNELMADYLNKHFISIKVDRERRPDVDKIYMTALMMTQGSGGWPMSSFLTPDGKPFFSGTYFPPEMFIQVLQQSSKLWRDEEPKLREIADKITQAVQGQQRGLKQAEHIGKERIQIAVINLLNRFDELQGGFSQAPKFPNETYLFLLLDTVIREQDAEVLEALQLTMSSMAQGGIYDQVGGGFHRYATDNEWLVPHFEKMLYNQAHLSRTYLQLFSITQDEAYKRVVTQTLDYVLQEMRENNGGFFSASDADSEGEEGKFFLWTHDELRNELTQVLGAESAKLATEIYGVTLEGNFSEQPQTTSAGTTILHLSDSIKNYAQNNNQELKSLYAQIDKIRDTLYKKRQKRIAPSIDRKVVTAWNGMMITAFAQAGKQFYEEKYIDVAKRVGDFLWQIHHVGGQSGSLKTTSSNSQVVSRLWRASLNGKASVTATLADYAYLAQSYLALYDVTEDQKWLQRSQQLMKEMLFYFWDKEEGVFYMTAVSDKKVPENEQEVVLFNRPKDIYDGAIPSSNAVALEVLSQLYYRTGDENYNTKALALIASLSSKIKVSPASFSYFLMAVNQLNFGELADVQYGGKGHVRIEKTDLKHTLVASKQRVEVEVYFTIDEHWHINSRYPKDEDLVATSISLGEKAQGRWKIIQAEYPQGEELQLKFNDSPLSLYQKSVAIKVIMEAIPQKNNKEVVKPIVAIPLQVDYQTCSNKVCLAPENKIFYVFPEKHIKE